MAISHAADVFISYCRATAKEQAVALSEALAADKIAVFLDLEEIDPGSPFPERLAEGLLNARTVVVFADAAYFQRTWCAYEFRVTVAGYRAGADRTLEHVVVALEPGEAVAAITSHFPPPLAQGSWPRFDETARLAALVRERLAGARTTVGQRLAGIEDDAVKSLRTGGLVPAPTAPPPRLVAPASMPESLKERFVGRADILWRVFSELETKGAGQAPRSCLVQGGGGMGKSQLAAEYVLRYGTVHYPGGIVWIDASGDDDDLGSQFRQVLEQFGRGDKTGTPLDDLRAELVEMVKSPAASRHQLWVVDNVPEPAPGRPPEGIVKWCPVKPHVSLLCTSRRGIGKIDATVLLGELPVEAAVDLLSRTPVERTWLAEAGWREIVQWIGCWPLGLQILHTSLGDGFVTAQSLLAKARGEEPAQSLDSAMAALRPEVEEGYLRGVVEVFQVSYTALQGQPESLLLAHALARLARAPVPEQLLEELASGPSIGILARRSLIQANEAGATRGWSMHRIVASYLRGVSVDPKREFLVIARWLRELFTGARPWSEIRGMQRHARIAARRFSSWLAASGDDEGFQVAAGLGIALATARLDDEAARGLRFTGAEFCDAIGAGDLLAGELDRLYASGAAGTRTAVVRILSGLHRNAQGASLLNRAFADPDPVVRWMAYTQASFSARADLLAIPLLDALMREPAGDVLRNAVASLGPFLKAAPAVLQSLLSRMAHHLTLVDADHRAVLANLLGEALRVHQGKLHAGSWNSRLLANALVALALNDPEETVRRSAAASAGRWENGTSYTILVEAMANAGDTEAWRQAGFAFARYCATVEQPPPPRAEMREVDGELQLVVSITPSTPRRPELYGPLVQAALLTTEPKRRAAAVEVVTCENTGKIALSNAVLDLIDAGRPNEALPVAEETIRQRPDFSSGYWWRGRALAALGRNSEALVDYTRVIELSPKFAEASYRRGILRAQAGDREGALADFTTAVENDGDHTAARFSRARTLHHLGRNEEAVQEIDGLISRWPQDVRLHQLKAGCLLYLERYPEAIAAATAALALNAGIAETWLIRCRAHAESGRLDLAGQDLEKAAALDPADPRVEEMRRLIFGGKNP